MPPISTSTHPTANSTKSSSHQLLLILNFPTLNSLFSKSHLPIVTESAKRTSSLLIQLRFGFEIIGIAPSTSSYSSSSTSASAGSSSKTTTTTINSNSSSFTPTSLFSPLQDVLASTYGAATKVFIAEDRPLDKVDIVIDKMRILGICFSSTQGETMTFDVATEDDEVSDSTVIGGGGFVSVGKDVQAEYEVTAMGGTFDHLHAGHKILLTMAAFITSKRLIVGVSDTVLLATKKYPEILEPLSYRCSQVRDFLELIKPLIQFDVVPLQDVYGPTAHDPEVTAIVVSEETRSGGEAVNKERSKKSLSILDVFVIPLISDEAEVESISVGGHEGSESTKVKVEDKMGSTGIRKWISERRKI